MSPIPADHPESSDPSANVDSSGFVTPTLPDKDLANFGVPPTLAPSDPQPGSTVVTHPGRHIGHYELVAELGRGGMGVVYKARDNQLNRFVAIKVIRGRDLDPDEAQRFRQEAELPQGSPHVAAGPFMCGAHALKEVMG